MIEPITSDLNNLSEITGTATAVHHFRVPEPPVATLPRVKPDAELVRAIGRSTSSDAFRGSSPDLQALLDALLANFGSEHELPDSSARSPETASRISENNQGSREAVKSLQDTAREGEETASVLKPEQRSESEQQKLTAPEAREKLVESERTHAESSRRVSSADSDLNQAEAISARGQEAAADAREQSATTSTDGAPSRDQQKLVHSADLFEQKAAAAESAARLRRVMAEKVLAEAASRVEKNRKLSDEKEEEVLRRLEGDREFFERVREMQRLLQGSGA